MISILFHKHFSIYTMEKLKHFANIHTMLSFGRNKDNHIHGILSIRFKMI